MTNTIQTLAGQLTQANTFIPGVMSEINAKLNELGPEYAVCMLPYRSDLSNKTAVSSWTIKYSILVIFAKNSEINDEFSTKFATIDSLNAMAREFIGKAFDFVKNQKINEYVENATIEPLPGVSEGFNFGSGVYDGVLLTITIPQKEKLC